MSNSQVHFEVFARRSGGGGFSLELATEDRERALEAAEELLELPRFVAVKVTKETLDPSTGEFNSVTVFNKGAPEKTKSKAPVEDAGPPCISPADFYTVHARDKIGRLLEGWLARNKATPFELLHRPDLIEKLEASGTELQHAVQKVAVPESQASGVSVHEIMRNLHNLIQRAIDRVLADKRKGVLPAIGKEDLGAICARLGGAADRQYLAGAAVAQFLAPAKTWSEKVDLLLDLAQTAPKDGPARALAFSVIEQPLGEILRGRVGLADLLGEELDLGGQLAALTRLAAAGAVDALARADASIKTQVPELTGAALRLSQWLDGPAFEGVRQALSQRILTELTNLRRLRPSDAHDEIEILRALAMALTAASGRLLPLEEVRHAFIERSKMLVATDFVDALLKGERTAWEDAQDLVRLMENVTGGANKRQAVRWLLSTVTSLKFETEMNASGDAPSARLAKLAELHRQIARSSQEAAGAEDVLKRIRELAGRIEAEAKLTVMLGKAAAPLAQRLSLLLKMASCETAPPGPAADRAKVEAMRLVRLPEARAELAKAPELLDQVRGLMQAAA